MYVRLYVHTYVRTVSKDVRMYVRLYVHTYVHTVSKDVRMYVRLYVHTYVHAYVQMCLYYEFTCTCMYE